jgi:hypothetical protein
MSSFDLKLSQKNTSISIFIPCIQIMVEKTLHSLTFFCFMVYLTALLLLTHLNTMVFLKGDTFTLWKPGSLSLLMLPFLYDSGLMPLPLLFT